MAIVLAAGKGTRMRSALPKVMHKVAGLPMVGHVLAAVRKAGIADTALVVSPGSDWAATLQGAPATFVQTEQRGTAHAVLAARAAVTPSHTGVVVLFADNPLVRPETIALMLDRVEGGADVAVLAFRAEDPTGYGRILMDDGRISAIREEKDASAEEKAVTLCNSGIMAIRVGPALDALGDIGSDNAKGEFYLTDLIALGRERDFVMVVEEAPFDEVLGVNDRTQLAAAEAVFQDRARAASMAANTLDAPHTVFFSHDTVLDEDVHVEPNVVFGPGVSVGAGATIRAFSHLEGAVVSPGATVGPFARLRPGAMIGPDAHIGNFVEIKNAAIATGAKVNHLAYIGDASVGGGANIGAGTITCNYDGVNKHRTEIGAHAFIGSNSALVAPVSIGEGAYVGSGSVVTEDVPPGSLAIARGRQVNKADRAPVQKRTPDRKP
ncbi:bifunctional UDP-N-acetylglucosamine diphosphorylase/glucosamine-1-phosphate N-acetyltransferase GlmU [Acuticoccus sp. MNP-M23]|uniref:bifunctional UDP-N-acetylglucosamine diphosphorylase/glucosamine-1-phosphate N-acetyltransferase GlmU n=1 Tax=Acuticoccus sp. MNP-M23 TaxID=3072793 RepID=UPI002815F736|nr:bifunctional UDP-N-acetylglucosamine diphosphorylase/glucosamine-1-phosphate N-acetyltransferase GlmU [Acuticoccus sp. MNP-M23]WMS41765.1 bifunctional UDP-N-acetylglucosamine diphosphorylase/glucosamine-1-phosphate N-acetyltransferase GlmU [Acuticoccus sp. MNP-M23]